MVTPVTITHEVEGYALWYNPGKPVRTPLGAPVRLPSRALATAVAEAVNTAQTPRALPPLARIACAAIDLTPPRREAIQEELLGYLETDLLRYRADPASEIGKIQALHWDPVIAKLEMRFAVFLPVTEGILPVPVEPKTVDTLRERIRICDAFAIAALSAAVTATGSLLLGLALMEGMADAQALIAIARLEEDWQAARFGKDEEQEQMLAGRAAEIEAAAKFFYSTPTLHTLVASMAATGKEEEIGAGPEMGNEIVEW